MRVCYSYNWMGSNVSVYDKKCIDWDIKNIITRKNTRIYTQFLDAEVE